VSADTFDIFSGSRHDPFWYESVEGLDRARERVKQVAAQRPGRYSVFCVQTGAVVATVDTSSARARRASGPTLGIER
jgi:hypothetical protein